MREFLEKFYEHGFDVQKKFQKMADNPIYYNRELLFRLLQDNKDTKIGQKYDFASIKTVEEYQKRVPISTYADYEDAILRMTENGETNILTSYPIMLYAKSSGTSGCPKCIPSTVEHAKVIKNYLCNLKYKLIGDKLGKDCFDGKCLLAVEKLLTKLPCGILYGPISSMMFEAFGENYEDYLTSPKEIVEFDGKSDLVYLTARFAMQEVDLTEIVATFSTRILDVFRYINKNSQLLIHDIETGTIDECIKILPKTKDALLKKIKPMPQRAEELRDVFDNTDDICLAKKIWPRLAYVQTIGTSSFKSYMDKLKTYIGDTDIFYVGLMASEGIFTYPLDINSTKAVPCPDFMFYEFLPAGTNNTEEIVTIDNLEIGKEYEIITTNLSGFYRYRMGDVVRVSGMYKNTPILEFVHRINYNVSIFGEKTGEDMFNDAIAAVEKKLGIDIVDYSAFEDKESEKSRYGLFVEIGDNSRKVTKEQLTRALDLELCSCNSSYKKCRESKMLSIINLTYLQPETYILLNEMLLYRGFSTAQIKPPHILTEEFKYNFLKALRRP
ncbi:MAG: GH3 auxin-responsive promoter family protein [Coriobacteriia bacterium]|nr:GH3 auxin-responsive promoter family protein [Coriobacteriia bacterium]